MMVKVKVFLRGRGEKGYVLSSRAGWKYPLQAKGLEFLD